MALLKGSVTKQCGATPVPLKSKPAMALDTKMARHPGADGGPKGWQDQPCHSNYGLQAPGSVSDRLLNCRATGGRAWQSAV